VSLEATLFSALSGDGGVAALVVARIYPGVAPEGSTYPYITYDVVAETSFNRMADAPDKERKVFQISCWSDDYDEALAVRDAAKAALEPISHKQGGGYDYYPEVQLHRQRMTFALIG
jgi:hypothetical protein